VHALAVLDGLKMGESSRRVQAGEPGAVRERAATGASGTPDSPRRVANRGVAEPPAALATNAVNHQQALSVHRADERPSAILRTFVLYSCPGPDDMLPTTEWLPPGRYAWV
jgi:hypothetical protein